MAFGIDIGTTNSSISWADDAGEVHSLSVRSGKEPFDSVIRSVVFDPLGDPELGEKALTEQFTRTAPLLASFKPKLDKQRLRRDVLSLETDGSAYDAMMQSERPRERAVMRALYDQNSREEVVAATSCLLRRLLLSDEIDREPTLQREDARRGVLSRFVAGLRPPSGGQTPTIEVPSERLRAGLQTDNPDPEDRLYIGVPVPFGPTARRRMLCALAGTELFGPAPACYRKILKACSFVYEPLAIGSTLQLFGDETVLVVDLGGGTLDLALFDAIEDERGTRVRERALDGRDRAGDHLDRIFREALLADHPRLRSAYEGLCARSDFDRLRANNAFSQAKIDLSTNDAATLYLQTYDRVVTRDELERAIQGEIDEIVAAVSRCLERGQCDQSDVTQVVLTGGSSMIPAIQHGLRALFPELDPETFVAARAADPELAREALTGVSRGLARYGFLERFESAASCDWEVWSPSARSLIPAVHRGDPEIRDLSASKAVRVPVMPGVPNSFALFADLMRRAFAGAVVDVEIPAGVDKVEVLVATHRERLAPAFAIRVPGASEFLAIYDLDAASDQALQDFLERDREWLPADVGLPTCGLLVRPLAIGDYVTWRRGSDLHTGEVRSIREIASAEVLERMRGIDPSPYRFEISPERRSQLGPAVDRATITRLDVSAHELTLS
jgi:hypothetical protein